jgi:hypothetical protein
MHYLATLLTRTSQAGVYGSPVVTNPDSGSDDVADKRKRRRSLRGEVGATGARFGSASLRRRLEEDHRTSLEDTAPLSGQFDETDLEQLEPEPERRPLPEPEPERRPLPEPQPEPEPEADASRRLVRPYARTGGRTTARHDLRLETLVSLQETGVAVAMRVSTPEQLRIAEMCSAPRSVAEVSALMSVPLGVARVLLSDLIDLGVITAHETAAGSSGPDLAVMQRVLTGLRNL